jgi:DNA-binding SARP family transcriptional activator
VQVRVLGPFEVSRDGRLWSPGGPKERKLLAVLVVHLGEVVSVDAIAEALWDGAPPRSAVKSVQAYVARLRAALGSGRQRSAGRVGGSRTGSGGTCRTSVDANVRSRSISSPRPGRVAVLRR